VQRFQAALAAGGWPHQVTELPQTTRRASDAAAAVGCDLGQIAKSLVFRTATTGQPIIVIASGKNRVDEQRLADQVGEPVEKPDADYVRAVTGYGIGGVPPCGHLASLRTLVDMDLLAYADIWAAAGSPFAVFRLSPDELLAMTAGTVLVLRQVD
jgi:prolyl-tRNA editing enzyme YbaK/EbsC (Cys-tRNA(Pro) deacylase)